MLRKWKFALLAVLPVFFMAACDADENTMDGEKGDLKLFMTDAPIETDGIESVFITFTEIQYQTEDGDWSTFDEFDEPVELDLLELTRGETELLGLFEMEPGVYNQIRFMLDAPERGQGPPSTPGSYLVFEDGSTTPLFVPSGGQSGYKAVGQFEIPANAIAEVTADFDARRSVVRAGQSGMYILKPTIRLVSNIVSGRITGDVVNIPAESEIMVYAYESGTYTDNEASEPAEEDIRFPNAINSDQADEEDSYHLDFLREGDYDLVVTSANSEGEFVEVLGMIEDVTVEAGETTILDIDIEEL
ncbi:MAG: DUF4382 domain-containing protein [Bacteroidales bacterium]